jgi:hypothetical protein
MAYDDRDAGCPSPGGEGPRRGVGVNDGRTRLDQLRRKRRKSIETVLGEAKVEADIPAIDVARS